MRQPNIIDQIIAKNIRSIRKTKGLSLSNVAPKIGVCYNNSGNMKPVTIVLAQENCGSYRLFIERQYKISFSETTIKPLRLFSQIPWACLI